MEINKKIIDKLYDIVERTIAAASKYSLAQYIINNELNITSKEFKQRAKYVQFNFETIEKEAYEGLHDNCSNLPDNIKKTYQIFTGEQLIDDSKPSNAYHHVVCLYYLFGSIENYFWSFSNMMDRFLDKDSVSNKSYFKNETIEDIYGEICYELDEIMNGLRWYTSSIVAQKYKEEILELVRNKLESLDDELSSDMSKSNTDLKLRVEVYQGEQELKKLFIKFNELLDNILSNNLESPKLVKKPRNKK